MSSYDDPANEDQADPLTGQLATIFRTGLQSRPELRQALIDELTRQSDTPTPEHKYTKTEANYRISDSDTERCGTCSHMTKSSCDLVSGSIDPSNVCDYYEPDPELRSD